MGVPLVLIHFHVFFQEKPPAIAVPPFPEPPYNSSETAHGAVQSMAQLIQADHDLQP